jgi:hypothetical protein
MPNIPPLAYNVVKHPVFIAATLLVLWWVMCYTLPEFTNNLCIVIGGWYIGIGIFHVSNYLSKKLQ